MHKKTGKAIILSITTLILILLSITPVSADVQHEEKELGQIVYIPDFEPFDPTIIDFNLPYNLVFPGNEYFIWDDHGGWWYDVEKTADNTDDDLMCWAAACSNTMEYTGWGMVENGTHTFINTDDIWYHYLDHWEDKTGLMVYGYEWWFQDGDPNGKVDVTGGGNYFPDPPSYTEYYHQTWENIETVEFIDEMLHFGYATSIGIRPGSTGGHAVTVWGYSYDPLETVGSKAYYTGLYVTDSDDDMSYETDDPPPNTLRYYTLDWDEAQERWELTDYGGGWWIDFVSAIEPRPGNNRPTAAVTAFGPVYEGSSLILDGSPSIDPDGDSLQYRWDFDEDNFWDAAWSSSPIESHIWNDNGQVTVLLEVFDGILKDTEEITVNVLNVPPTVEAGSDITADEGTTVSFSGSFTDPGTEDTHTIEWDFGDGETATGSLTPSNIYTDNGVYTVTLTVTDDDGGEGQDTLTVTVNNVLPTVEAGEDQIVDEGQLITLDPASFTDLGTEDTHTATIDWDDGTVTDGTVTESSGSGTVSGSHIYGDNGVYTVTVTVLDDDGGEGQDTLTVTVNNVAPDITVTGDAIDENSIATVSGTITDPGTSDTFTVTINWGEGTPVDYLYPAGSTSFSETHQYLDDNPTGTSSDTYTVIVTVTDDDLGSDTETTSVTVSNVDPEITSEISIDHSNTQFILPNVHTVDFTVEFSDIGILDTHIATWDWGDSNTEPGTVTEISGSGTVTGSHVYSTPGYYTVTVTVTDDDTGSASKTLMVHVVTPEEAVMDLNNYINNLPDDAFDKKADQTKNTLDNMLSSVIEKILYEEYLGAVNQLTNIRSKMDGDKKDWITDSDSQTHLMMKIDDIIAYLETQL